MGDLRDKSEWFSNAQAEEVSKSADGHRDLLDSLWASVTEVERGSLPNACFDMYGVPPTDCVSKRDSCLSLAFERNLDRLRRLEPNFERRGLP